MRTVLLIFVLAQACIQSPNPVGPSGDLGMIDAGRDARVDPVPDAERDANERDLGSQRIQFRSIAIANRTACAATESGRLICWGANASRLLADDADETVRPPFWRDERFHFTQLTAGTLHICGLARSGVECWGDNTGDQSSPGGNDQIGQPTEVLSQSAAELSAGAGHTCVLDDSRGVAVCWGTNTNGRVSPELDPTQMLPPTPVAGSDGATIVAAGTSHTCVAISGSADEAGVWCWGSNNGFRSDPNASSEVALTEPTRADARGFTALDAADITCGVTGDVVSCWGDNSEGALGGGGPGDRQATVAGVVEPTNVVVSTTHACALEAAGTIWCWGEWMLGGDGAGQRFSAPEGQFRAVSVGPHATCATTGTALYCWGTNGADGLAGRFDQEGAPENVTLIEPEEVAIPAR